MEKLRSVPLWLFLSSCSSGAVGTMQLSWQFADGRRCSDAGVANVALIENDVVLGNFACELGDVPKSVMVENAPLSGRMVARALSFQLGELYRGELTLGPALLPSTVTLHPTQSR